MTAPSSPAVEWATTVTPRHYRQHRDELDALVVAVVPAYAERVAERLEGVEAAVAARREQLFAEAVFVRPRRVRWAQRALFTASFLAVIVAFGFMYPTGGRAYVPVDWSTLPWPLFVALAAICLTLGVLIQLVRRLPVRRLPSGRAVPPRKDLGWFAIGFGVPTVVMMALQTHGNHEVQPGWVVLAAAALAVGIVDAAIRTAQRRSDPALTKQVDTSERRLVDALRSSLIDRADDCADAIEADLAALPEADRSRLLDELSAATLVLQRRGLIRIMSPEETRMIAKRMVGRSRTMVPGFLLLEHRVRELWRPPTWEPGWRPAAYWFIPQYSPAGARDPRR